MPKGRQGGARNERGQLRPGPPQEEAIVKALQPHQSGGLSPRHVATASSNLTQPPARRPRAQ